MYLVHAQWGLIEEGNDRGPSMDEWEKYKKMVERNARSDLLGSDPALIEQVCRCLVYMDKMDVEAGEEPMTSEYASKMSIVLSFFFFPEVLQQWSRGRSAEPDGDNLQDAHSRICDAGDR